MNLQEFAALKVGDQVECPMNGSHGEVTAVAKDGVRVRWSVSSLDFAYAVNSTAWFHWTKPETVRERNPANCEHDVAMDIFCELCEPGK